MRVFTVYLSSIENLQYTIFITLLIKYYTKVRSQYHEEQNIMSTPWHEEKSGNYVQKDDSQNGGLEVG